jgi:hypothetical protein
VVAFAIIIICSYSKHKDTIVMTMMKTFSSFVVVVMALFSSVDSFVVTPSVARTTSTKTAIYQSSIPADYATTSSYQQQKQQKQERLLDIEILKQQQQQQQKNNKLSATNVYDPLTTSSGVTSSPPTTATEQEQKLLQGLYEMSLKDLKLQCSRRSITYYKFTSQQQFIDAVWQDMQKALSFSVTGLIKPGMVGDITGTQLDQEMTASGMILVDVNAKWYVYYIISCCCYIFLCFLSTAIILFSNKNR